MARPARIEYEGAFYHVMNRGNRGEVIFQNDSDRYKFYEILGNIEKRYGIIIYAFVLMPNHYHILLETPRANLSRAIQRLNGDYALYFSNRYKTPGHLFQGRFKAMIVERDAYLLELSRYIHLNPLRAGITKSSSKYKWSSFSAYISGNSQLPFTLHWEWVLSIFGKRRHLAADRYLGFVMEGMNKENPAIKAKGGWILGNEKWVKKVLKKIVALPSMELTGIKSIKNVVPLVDLERLVCKEFRVNTKEIKTACRNNVARQAIIHISVHYFGLTLKEACKRYNGSSYFAVGQSISRFRKRLAKDRELGKRIGRIMSNVKM